MITHCEGEGTRVRRSSFSGSAVRISLVATVILLLLVAPAMAVAQNGDPMERAKAVQERISGALMARDGIVGTGVGINGAGVPVIRVYTVHEGIAGIPRSADGFAVRPVVTGLITASSCPGGDPTKRCDRPVPIGVSVGHPSVTAGTIGARVSKNGKVYALSNNHVLANSNNAVKGDAALQPGSYDGGTDPADRIGTLDEWKIINFNYTSCTSPISPDNPACNLMDAAIAVSTTGNLGATTLAGWAPASATATTATSATPTLSVLKCGRTTGCTVGSVAEVNVVVDVCYAARGIFCTSIARFVNQFTVSPGTFSAGGDSGSLIVTNNAAKNPTGLLFAGSSTRTIANPISAVLGHFGVSVDSSSSEPPPSDTTAPAPPTNLTATAGDAQVSLSWTANTESDLAGYNVYQRSPSSGGGDLANYSKVNTSLLTGPSFTGTGLTNGTTYYFVVTAVDTSGNESTASDEASATPVAAPAPGAPSDLSATKRIQGTVRVDLAWTGGAATINVFRALDTGAFSQVASVSNSGAYTDNLGKRPTAGTYRYMVCNAGTTTCSGEASVGAP